MDNGFIVKPGQDIHAPRTDVPKTPTAGTPSQGGRQQQQAAGNWMNDFQQSSNATYPYKPNSVVDQLNAMPNADKLSPVERWIYQKLPGFSESSVGKALSAFSDSPAGKVLGWLDIPAEGVERTLGFLAQMRDLQPGEEFRWKDAWAAGSLFYDTAKLPRVQYDANGRPTAIRVDDSAPGAYALTEARRMLQNGATLDEVKSTLYGNMGALALRAQLRDTLGHVVADPLNFLLGWLKPVEKVHAIRNLALAGKLDVNAVRALEQEARLAGNLEDAAKFGEAITQAEKTGKAMTRLDRFAIAISGGTPWLEDVNKMTPAQKLIGKLNPFALTPQARASELLDMVAANVGERLVVPNWGQDPAEFIKTVQSAARGSINGDWGHLMGTIEGRTVQGVLSNSDAVVKQLGKEWTLYSGERNLFSRLAAALPGEDERSIWQLAKDSPEVLFKRLTKAAEDPLNANLLRSLQAGEISPDAIQKLGQISSDIPLLHEEFYAKALVSIQDVAMRQSIIQFGIKEKGIINKWSDALKSWETIPFIKANPANMIRNVVNNDITLIGRGLFGTMTGKAIDAFWEGKYIPQQFMRGFGLGGDEVKLGSAFEPGNAYKEMIRVLEGKQGLARKVQAAAQGIDLKAFDFSKLSSKFELSASKRASTMGWIEFHRNYWNPRTGFTSFAKHASPDVVDTMEKMFPGITQTIDDIAQSSGADSAKFAELMQSNIEHNVTTIFKNASDRLGFDLEQTVGPEIMHTLAEGLPAAIKKGDVQGFVSGIRTQMEAHVDDLFNKHLENLPGIIEAQVQAGGALQYHRIFGKAVDELWGGNVEHAIRMSTINEVIDYAKQSGNYEKANQLWTRIMEDSQAHFGRVWKKFDAYQQGLEQGAVKAGIKYPKEVSGAFGGVRKGWEEFFNFRNEAYSKFFKSGEGSIDQIQGQVESMYRDIIKKEDGLYQRIDDLMTKSLPNKIQQEMYTNYRDMAANLRTADREKTVEFFAKLRSATPDNAPDMWQQYWAERMQRLEQMRQLDVRGSAAIQGDINSTPMFLGKIRDTGTPPATVADLANQYGVASATGSGARNDRRILSTINKYLPEGTDKFKKVEDIPLDVAQQAFERRTAAQISQVPGQEASFIPDAEKIFKDPPPIETALSELNYGRSYAAMDAITQEATAQASKTSRRFADLPQEAQDAVNHWMKQVNDEMGGFRAAGVQYAAFRRDSALLNYNRRTNFDSWLGNIAPFAFWTTHSMANWAIYSLDRPAMLTTYFRTRKFFETAGLPDQKVPARMKGNIRVNLPFTPKWMGDTFINPTRFLLPFDGFMQPWEQAYTADNQKSGKIEQTLNQMYQQGKISEADYNDAIDNKRGPAFNMAQAQVDQGGDNYDSMDFVQMMMTPHAPLMWAYNAARGTPNNIGPFTPMSRTVRNLATMMGVKDWSNSPYNVEGRIRRELGLPAYDRWDDYRTQRMISNMAAEGKYDMRQINDAMEVATLVEAGKLDSKEAVATNKLYAEAVYRANQESAGGWAGTVLSAAGVPVKAYPVGEQAQRALGDEFGKAYDQYKAGNVDALKTFFDKHPEYESRLALFKSPQQRLQNFMVDHIWSRWNDLPDVTQKEVADQLGPDFQTYFLNKDTRSYDTLTPLQMQVWTKLMGGNPVGKLTADQSVMVELNRLKLTDPSTAWRVQTFYDMRDQEYPDWSKLQNKYYALPQGKTRDQFARQNPVLKDYWDARRSWMQKNPDLVRFLTDDPAQIKKYENTRRNANIAVPTAQELKSQFSPEAQQLLQDWQSGQNLPPSMERYLSQLAAKYNVSTRELAGILTGK